MVGEYNKHKMEFVVYADKVPYLYHFEVGDRLKDVTGVKWHGGERHVNVKVTVVSVNRDYIVVRRDVKDVLGFPHSYNYCISYKDLYTKQVILKKIGAKKSE